MGKHAKRFPRSSDETPGTLIALADQLETIEEALRRTALGMQAAGVRTINVRYGAGAHRHIEKSLVPFAWDAAKKAKEAGAKDLPSDDPEGEG